MTYRGCKCCQWESCSLFSSLIELLIVERCVDDAAGRLST